MKTITGNLLDIRTGTILHQVNCRGVMGGLAYALYRRWPAAFDDYFRLCNERGAEAHGLFLLTDAEPGLCIGHIFGQIEPGADTSLPAVIRSLHTAHQVIIGAHYAPFKMGCGIGGGDWAKYSAAIERHLPEAVIVQRPEDSASG